MSDTVELEFRLCGGISTLESGFSFASTEVEGEKIHFLCNSEGQMFARFFEKGRRVESAKKSFPWGIGSDMWIQSPNPSLARLTQADDRENASHPIGPIL